MILVHVEAAKNSKTATAKVSKHLKSLQNWGLFCFAVDPSFEFSRFFK